MPIDVHDLSGCLGDFTSDGCFDGCFRWSWRLLIALLFLVMLGAGIYLLLRGQPGDMVAGGILAAVGGLGTLINLIFWWKAPPETH